MAASRLAYTIDPENNLIIGSAEGVIDYEDFDLHMRDLAENPEFGPGLNGLYDFSKTERIIGDPSFLESTSEQITHPSVDLVPAKVALVTGGQRHLEGIFSGWKVMMSQTVIVYETFDTETEAREWLASK